jgi:hypothetical protein
MQSAGWILLTFGFALVLYSRLHLIVDNPKGLKGLCFVLFVIVVTYLPSHILTLVAGQGLLGVNGYHVASHLGIIFNIEETLLSSLYIYLFFKFMRDSTPEMRMRMKSFFYLLVLAQVFIFICDVILTTLAYVRLDLLTSIAIPFIYTVKLKAEFVVLNRLVRFARTGVELQEISAATNVESTGESAATSTRPFWEPHNIRETAQRGFSFSIIESPISARHRASEISDEEGSFVEVERRYLGQWRSDIV